jgi:hypothetical protein
MQIAQKNDDPYLVAYAVRSLGEAYMAAGNFDMADQHLQGSLALFRQLDISGEIAATERLLADMHVRRAMRRVEDASPQQA